MILVSLLIFCILVLSVTKEKVKSPTIIVDFSFLLFIFVSFYLTYFKALLLGGSSMWKYTEGDNLAGSQGPAVMATVVPTSNNQRFPEKEKLS